MSSKRAQEIENRSEELQQVYQNRFAGRSRVTRDLREMEWLRDTAARLVEEARYLIPPPTEEGMALLTERRDRYASEYEEIQKAQQGGAAVRQGAELAREANSIFAIYARHFAGKGRASRDMHLLAELRADVDGVRERMERLAEGGHEEVVRENLDVVRRQLDLQDRETRAIEAAREELSAGDRVGTLATRANELFAWYRTHFAGRPRLSRRPALLERMLRSLREVQQEMRDTRAPDERASAHIGNQNIVGDQLANWESELEKIRAERESTTVEQLVGALGAEANDIMGAYRQDFSGVDRSTCDIEKLGGLADRMHEVTRQAAGLQRRVKDDTNRRNVLVMRDALEMLNTEYKEVREAQPGS